MNLYLIQQTDVNDYDIYHSAVVVAESPEEARKMHPKGNGMIPREHNFSWTNDPSLVEVTLLGRGEDWLRAGDVMCASYDTSRVARPDRLELCVPK